MVFSQPDYCMVVAIRRSFKSFICLDMRCEEGLACGSAVRFWGTGVHGRTGEEAVVSCQLSVSVLVLAGGGFGGGGALAVAVEDVGFYFAFGALSGNFLAVPGQGDGGGVADFDDDFASGANGEVGGSDESFLSWGLSVGGGGDPGIFCGADE